MPSSSVPGASRLHSGAASKSALRNNHSPAQHVSTSPPPTRKPDLIPRDTRHDSETRARHLASLHHSTASSRDQSVTQNLTGYS